MLKKILVLLIGLAFIPLVAHAAPAPSIKGTYTEVQGKEFKFDGKTVEVVEFLSFYCGSCYKFEESVPVVKGNFPRKIKWTIVPVYWGQASTKPSEAYFLADEAGKGEEMKKALFRANFIEKKDIGNIQVLESLAAEMGLGFDFSRKLRTGAKAEQARKALDLAREYGISETPSLVIAGNLLTSPHTLNHDLNALKDNAITIIGSILKK
ncbi:MAG: DsbA family protein [Deltaproteobacteria bacterium]|nr:DsbA family protein [Deltaproteobacteria bacterium]MCL4872959.1 DsbA family protein [bacterium]